MRTQNPPPLKACRFDSDLGHQFGQRLTRAKQATGTTCQTHRTFTAQHADFGSSNTYTFLTHKSTATGRPQTAASGASQDLTEFGRWLKVDSRRSSDPVLAMANLAR